MHMHYLEYDQYDNNGGDMGGDQQIHAEVESANTYQETSMSFCARDVYVLLYNFMCPVRMKKQHIIKIHRSQNNFFFISGIL